MTLWLVLAAPWVLGALLTLGLAHLEALFAPEWFTRILAVTAVVLAMTTWTSVMALAATAIGWSVPVALLVGGGLVWTLTGVVRHGLRVVANLRAGRLFRNSPGRVDDVLIVDSSIPDAFAVPGRRAVVVVTSALASALDGDEFRAVLEHERAHLVGRHSMFIQAVHLAARLNPMLNSWCAAVRFAAERAADERAATRDRSAAVRAVARVALLCSGSLPAAWVGIGGRPGEVVRRVDALQRPAPRPQRARLIVAATAVVMALTGDLVVVADVAQDRIAPESNESTGEVFG